MSKVDIEIAERIKQVRLKLDLLQVEFGRAIGISRSHVSGIEKGKMPATERVLDAICFKFGINRKWLYEGAGEMEGGPGEVQIMRDLERWAEEKGGDFSWTVTWLKTNSGMFRHMLSELGADAEALCELKRDDPQLVAYLRLKADDIEREQKEGGIVTKEYAGQEPVTPKLHEDPELAETLRDIQVIAALGRLKDVRGYVRSAVDLAVKTSRQASSSAG